MRALNELRLTIILFAICLGYATISWIHSLVRHLDTSRDFHHSDTMFFGVGVGVLLMIWACIMRYMNYRKLRKEHDQEK
jgi:hypothetical protein